MAGYQIPKRETKRPKPVKCVKFEFFFNRDNPCKKKKKGNLNAIEEKASHGC